MSNNYKKIADVYKSTERNALVESEDPSQTRLSYVRRFDQIHRNLC
jgi:hypothetical protein